MILTIDGAACHGLSLDKLRSLILGEVGTFVTLEFERQAAHDAPPAPFQVLLVFFFITFEPSVE